MKTNREESLRVLACGIDSLVLAIDLEWQSDTTFEKLKELKVKAKVDEADCPGKITLADGSAAWVFVVKRHGKDGYEWLLNSGELAMSLGNWKQPKSRPSAMVEIRSETLWHHGPEACVSRVTDLFLTMGARVVKIKVSRADLNVDVLLPETDWSLGILDHLVTRAAVVHPYLRRDRLEGIAIGRGAISARFYDKPQEIAVQSHKFWMYDIWGLERVPVGFKIIRVEFQLRREAIKELGIDTFDDLIPRLPNLWVYCTHEWLKVQDDPHLHHTQQKTLPWWQLVQVGYTGAQGAFPLVRAKAIRQNDQQNALQILGFVTSQTALWRQGETIQAGEVLDMQSHTLAVMDAVKRSGLDNREFTERVKRKQAKYTRAKEKFAKATRARASLGVSFKGRISRGSQT